MGKLNGKTILLTRTAEGNRQWAGRIEALGGRAIGLPCISCETIRSSDTSSALKKAILNADWLVCTSRRGVQAVAELYAAELPKAIKIAAVGKNTQAEAMSRWGRCDLVGPTGTGAGLAAALAERLAGNDSADGPRVVAATAKPATYTLEETLGPLGISVERIIIYETRPAPVRESKEILAGMNLDAIVLASPSAVRGLLNIAELPPSPTIRHDDRQRHGKTGLEPRASGQGSIRIISIGPTTTRQAEALGLKVAAEAAYPDFESIVEVLS